MADKVQLPPRATYRLQLSRGFTFADARNVAPHLAALGVSHAYLSPILAARAGSAHGYDVVDHDRLSSDLGTPADFYDMVSAMHRHGVGIILDLVPNHMGIGAENPRWMELLRWGPAARNAGFFDIDWDPPQPYLAGKVMLPVLDRPIEAVLNAREIRIEYGCEGFTARWRGQVWPITPPSLPVAAGLDASSVAAELNHAPPERLHQLLDRQCWLLAEWRRAAAEINYRRFFAINDLAAIRVEDEAVFEASHHLILRLVEEGAVDGLRIDHVDGLADPRVYLERLHRAVRARGREPYILVEKILAEGETLPDCWPVAGSTGYDRLGKIDRLFCDETGAKRLIDGYRRETGQDRAGADLVRIAKRNFLQEEYISEINRVARKVAKLCGLSAMLSDRSVGTIARALREIIVGLPVYRCYVDRHGASVEDCRRLQIAFEAAALQDRTLADFLRGILTADDTAQSASGTDAILEVATLFEQISGPAMAKGLEDTVFYQFAPLLALNEVGGGADPRPLGIEAFHDLNQIKLRTRPDELIAGSTHDTKRGEDARARLLGLTSAAEIFEADLLRWNGQTSGDPAIGAKERYYIFQTMLGGWPPGLQPDDAPGLAAFCLRLRPALLKAAREAKELTSWTAPNPVYEAALGAFTDALLNVGQSAAFLADFAAAAERFGFWGALTSLSATLLRLTIPGVPDVFQGSEGWNFSMVDPDNRRAVDFAAFARQGRAPLPRMADLPSSWHDGAIKTALIRRVLDFRRQRPRLFSSGDYQPLRPSGACADCLVAFSRTGQGARIIVLAPRFWPRLWPDAADAAHWADTRLALPPGLYRNQLTGIEVSVGDATERPVAELLDTFPCALLSAEHRGA